MNRKRIRDDATSATVQVLLTCPDLDATIAFYCDTLGLRLDMIMPADAPRIAELSGHGISLRLQLADRATGNHAATTLRLQGGQAKWPGLPGDGATAPDGTRVVLADEMPEVSLEQPAPSFLITRADSQGWIHGRAGMHYRDLIAGRLGGRVIASQIRIAEAGPVPDYVHYHRVGVQVIYCRHGWVRVVYEDQGPPFVMHAGDCVLQPPTIRHRVLEASAGLEVIELSCPAEHPTFRDHALSLPTTQAHPRRLFGGQRFVRHIADHVPWWRSRDHRVEYRDTGIARASHGAADIRVKRMVCATAARAIAGHVGHDTYRFLMVLDGPLYLRGSLLGTHKLHTDDACIIGANTDYGIDAEPAANWLEITLPLP